MDIDKIIELVNYIGNITSSGEVALIVFIQLSIALLFYFGGFLLFIFKAANIHVFNEKKYKREKAIIINHVGIELIIAFIASFLFLLLINTKNNNYLINMIAVPLIGAIVGRWADNNFFGGKEYEPIYRKKRPSKIPVIQKSEKNLSQDIIDSDDFQPIIVNAINSIQEKQVQQEEKLNSTFDILSRLLEAEKNEKRVSLKKQMYDCLANGYVKPAEREKIEAEYNDYRELLGGNHDVQQLYENHYSKLSVHEDRRKQNRKVSNERRQEKRNCEYGQYDKESET